MDISLQNAGKKYGKHWIFKDINVEIVKGDKIAILGANGSGKSTLLKCIASHTSMSSGEVIWKNEISKLIPETEIFNHYTLIAPALELIEELTLKDFLKLHFSFKKKLGISEIKEAVTIVQLEKSYHKSIKYFSSGMKQRIKLLMAFFTQNDVLLLDEPTSNLDAAGEEWYLELVDKTKHANRLFIICSNQEKEYTFCDQRLSISDYKS